MGRASQIVAVSPDGMAFHVTKYGNSIQIRGFVVTGDGIFIKHGSSFQLPSRLLKGYQTAEIVADVRTVLEGIELESGKINGGHQINSRLSDFFRGKTKELSGE